MFLDNISLPVAPHDLILGRIRDEVPDEEGEAFFQESLDVWQREFSKYPGYILRWSMPPWMTDGGHECFDWESLLRLGLPGLQAFAEKELSRRLCSVGERA